MPTERGPQRALSAVRAAQAALQTGEAEPFSLALSQQHGNDIEMIATLQAGMIRWLLEDLHPAGLDSEDARELVVRVVTEGAASFPAVDPTAVIVVVTSALGLAEADESESPLPRAVLVVHAHLVIAELVRRTARPFEPYLQRALAEVERAQTIELP